VSVEGNTITKEWGEIGGAIQKGAPDVIKVGKNIGRANETTPEMQAELEALAMWQKKLKSGAVRSLKEAEAGKTDDVIAGGYFPMLAHRFDKYPDKIQWPAFVQPKLDGHRCPHTNDEKQQASLWSRTRKPILSMPHIVAAINKLGMPPCSKLDGELYNHEYRDNFEKLTSLIRPQEPREGHELVQYHIYDTVGDASFAHRYKALQVLEKHSEWGLPLVLVETILCEGPEEMYAAYDRFMAEGYEGAIVRNADGVYGLNKRSYDLQKVKKFDDAEFPIVGVEEGRGKLAGHGIFICKTGGGTNFEVKLKGYEYVLKDILLNPDKYIGKSLTVQYFGITKKSEVPRFPVGLRLREDV
jgi:ATP-dependent DNA ligase